MTSELALKESRLRDLLASFDSVIVAFSGGVDSAYLGWVATQVLGPAALSGGDDHLDNGDRLRHARDPAVAARTARRSWRGSASASAGRSANNAHHGG